MRGRPWMARYADERRGVVGVQKSESSRRQIVKHLFSWAKEFSHRYTHSHTRYSSGRPTGARITDVIYACASPSWLALQSLGGRGENCLGMYNVWWVTR